MIDKCNICGEEIEAIFTDEEGNIYCEDCWIEYESKLKNLRRPRKCIN